MRASTTDFVGWQALWTLVLFVTAVTWITGAVAVVVSALWGPVLAIIVGAISAMSAFAMSASIGAVATGLLGIPLIFAVSALLRRSRSVIAQVCAAAGAGVVSALAVLWAYSSLYGSGGLSAEVFGDPIPDPTLAPIAIALVVITAASSAGGWLIALRQHAPDEPAAEGRA
ncbi:hypothetical protein EYE40_05050 [Glaciihabitans arcticus]|uniref:Uncharacterized protein n=1 Tax=Glaciihabitans arcticus TaxID=2668039 RepID=A0A4Q9GPT2_9MICO|nr:hypothetical protein [Glaciihabitans arcticus]TBN56816.1 hypothetical protein EYE40_05050 [Glaciihabitans arcticus]